MYLKYTPGSSVRSNAVVRDIARAVTTSSVGSNEFDSGVSSENVIEGNTSHGWTLDSRDTFSTDATPGVNDQKYRIYNTTAAAGIKKALSLKQNANHTSSTMYNSTYGSTGSGGIALFPLMAYETAEELECWGHSGANNAYYRYNSMNKASAGFKTIHIFAGPKYFIMAGWDYLSDVIVQGYVEVDKTTMHDRWESITGRTSPSAVFFTVSGSAEDGIGHCYYGQGNGSQNHAANWINLPEMAVMSAYNKAYKNVYFGGARWDLQPAEYDSFASIDDGTSTGTTTGVTVNYDYGNNNRFFTDNTGMWNWLDVSRADYLKNYTNNFGKNNYYQDASGTKHVPLWPMVIDASFYMSGVTMNISKYCPIYYSLPDQGALGDTMTVGSDKYIYLGDNTTGRRFGFFIKVE